MKKNLLITLWLLAPIAAVGLLAWWIAVSLNIGPAMRAEPVGPGAGDTGGANALGEFFAGSSLDPGADLPAALPMGAMLVVRDRTGRASPDAPMYLACADNGWAPDDGAWRLERGADGRWVLDLPAGDVPFEFMLTLGSWATAEVRTDVPEGGRARGVPRALLHGLGPGQRPTLEVEVTQWGPGTPPEPDEGG